MYLTLQPAQLPCLLNFGISPNRIVLPTISRTFVAMFGYFLTKDVFTLSNCESEREIYLLMFVVAQWNSFVETSRTLLFAMSLSQLFHVNNA